jgi:sphingolipid C9-methyltransferase
MVYTSGIFESDSDTLEQAQTNKFEQVLQKLHVKEGETLLDIGCGWGAFIRYASKNYKVKCTGVSLSSSQQEWHEQKCKDEEIDTKNCQFLCRDYREIEKGKKFDKISCLEMSEHVGVLKYKAFCNQVYDLLEDDGLFYLQIAGLRMATQIEDYCWAFFMDKYIFPGADASLPLTFPIIQLELSGFEIDSVKNIGIHYSLTIHRWYKNWISNKEKAIKAYGVTWYRLWEWFLAWSTIIPRQGNTTCWMIIAHKNFDHFPRQHFWVAKNPQF